MAKIFNQDVSNDNQTITTVYGNTNNDILTRQASITYVEKQNELDVTLLIDSSTYVTGDRLIFIKQRRAGLLLVSLDANAIVYPDSTFDGNFTIPDGTSATGVLTKNADLNWTLSV